MHLVVSRATGQHQQGAPTAEVGRYLVRALLQSVFSHHTSILPLHLSSRDILLFMCVCRWVSPLFTRARPPPVWPHFNWISYICSDPVCKLGHILRFWEGHKFGGGVHYLTRYSMFLFSVTNQYYCKIEMKRMWQKPESPTRTFMLDVTWLHDPTPNSLPIQLWSIWMDRNSPLHLPFHL